MSEGGHHLSTLLLLSTMANKATKFVVGLTVTANILFANTIPVIACTRILTILILNAASSMPLKWESCVWLGLKMNSESCLCIVTTIPSAAFKWRIIHVVYSFVLHLTLCIHYSMWFQCMPLKTLWSPWDATSLASWIAWHYGLTALFDSHATQFSES